jgi:hypothetical protein
VSWWKRCHNLGLPPAIERLDRPLEAMLPHGGEHGHDLQAQAESGHPPDRVPELMGPLEARVVVELGVGRQAPRPPVGHQRSHDRVRRHGGQGPRRDEPAVERDAGEDLDRDPPFDHQVLDGVEAVEFPRLRREVPAQGRRRGPHPAAAIEGPPAHEDAADRPDGGWGIPPAGPLPMDRDRPVLAQGTPRLEVTAHREHARLHGCGRAVHCGRDGGPVRPGHPIQTLSGCPLHPALDGGTAHTETPGDRSHRLARADRYYHRASTLFSDVFFAMSPPPVQAFTPSIPGIEVVALGWH